MKQAYHTCIEKWKGCWHAHIQTRGLYFERDNSVATCKRFILPAVTSALGIFSALICILTIYHVSRVYETEYWKLKDEKACVRYPTIASCISPL